MEVATGSYSVTGDSLQYIYSVPVTKNHRNIRSRCLVHEFFDVNHGYRAAILKKNSLWLLPFYMVWLLISIMKRCAERCALQLYQTSLNNLIVRIFSQRDMAINFKIVQTPSRWETLIALKIHLSLNDGIQSSSYLLATSFQ